MPFAASVVMKLRRPEWLVAPCMPAALYIVFNVWHRVLGVNALFFWEQNRGISGADAGIEAR